MGLDENHAASVEPVRMLCEALAPTKATIILLHHASSTNAGERAVKASRGTKALPAEASQIIDLDWLIPEDKNDNRIKVSTAGRNSTPVDMVIEQVDRAVWVDHGSSSEIAETLRLEQVRAKLSERQELDRRRDYAIQNGASDDAISILDNLSNEYEANYLDDVEL